MSAFTPGPWKIDPEFDQVWNSKEEMRVADCDHKTGGVFRLPRSERFANAKLIAAAPEMAEALRHLVNENDGCDFDDDPLAECTQDLLCARCGARAALEKAGVL